MVLSDPAKDFVLRTRVARMTVISIVPRNALCLQPFLDDCVPGLQCAQPFSDDLAFKFVGTGRHLGPNCFGHLNVTVTLIDTELLIAKAASLTNDNGARTIGQGVNFGTGMGPGGTI